MMDTGELFVPGRLCLFGEHSDWAGGYRRHGLDVEPGMSLVVGTDQGLRARYARQDGFFQLSGPDADGRPGEPTRYRAEPSVLRAVAEAAGFDSYAAGVAHYMVAEHGAEGLELEVTERTLPLRKGLSSSAAISVLTARAYNRAWGLGLSVEDEMELAYRGEVLTGSPCGRMDQACAYGRVPVVLLFDGDEVTIEPLEPRGEIHLLVVDLQASKDTRRILTDLNAAFLDQKSALGHGVREALGAENLRIVGTAARLLQAGDAMSLGRLMTESQEIFDRLVAPASPHELDAPRLHRVLVHAASRDLAFGGKGVGSQGDGTAQLVCRGPQERRLLAERLASELGVSTLDLTIQTT